MKLLRDIAGLWNERGAGLIKGALFFAALATTGIVEDEAVVVADQITQERAYFMRLEELARHQTSIVAACMDGGQFWWTDPHTGSDFAAFCDVEELGRVGR